MRQGDLAKSMGAALDDETIPRLCILLSLALPSESVLQELDLHFDFLSFFGCFFLSFFFLSFLRSFL